MNKYQQNGQCVHEWLIMLQGNKDREYAYTRRWNPVIFLQNRYFRHFRAGLLYIWIQNVATPMASDGLALFGADCIVNVIYFFDYQRFEYIFYKIFVFKMTNEIPQNHIALPSIKTETCSMDWFIISKVVSTHQGHDKMATILLTTFSNTFSLMKTITFWFKFYWSFSLWVQLTILHSALVQIMELHRWQAIIWNNDTLVYWCIDSSFSFDVPHIHLRNFR